MTSVAGAPDSKSRKSSKRFIKSSVVLHDRTQLETVFDYLLVMSNKTRRKAPNSEITRRTVRVDSSSVASPLPQWRHNKAPGSVGYQVDTYLFYPRQFGINEHTYPKERFYADVRPMLRFREPKMGFKTMVGGKDNEASPLLFLREYLDASETGRELEPIQNAIDEVRLFACAYIGTYFRSIDRNRKRVKKLLALGDSAKPEELASVCLKINRMIDRADQTLREFWGLRDVAKTLSVGSVRPLLDEMQIVEEYCYYRLRDGASYLLQFCQRLSVRFSSPAIDELKESIMAVLAAHDARARDSGFMMPSPTSTNADKERFIHRRGELKRHIWEVLFLEIRTVPLFAVQRQLGAMIAAGLAATWALVAQFMIILRIAQEKDLADGIGLSGLVFLSAGILAYVIKDRIKEVGRSYFGGGVFRRVPDHSERIYYKNRFGKPTPVGDVKEVARFIKPEDLPSRIVELRDNTPESEVYGAGGITRILHYSKSIKLSGKLMILGRYPLRAVHDISRLNIDACLSKLGEPRRMVDLVTEDGDVEAVRFPKVYYLDMILSYWRLTEKGERSHQGLEYYRLVIDKNGLLRIERMN